MGFLDNFKEAMKRGAEAADNYIERERANQAAAANAPKPSAHSGTTHKSNLPEGVVMSSLDNELFVYGDVTLAVSGALLTKRKDGDFSDPAAQRAEVKAIAREILERELPLRGADSGDLKTLLLAGTSIGKTILSDLDARGYEAAFKLPLMIRPKQ